MKIPFLFSFIVLFGFGLSGSAQNVTLIGLILRIILDWIEMMQDPGVNFFKVQSAFNKYWKIENHQGCGWKPFKRWEYMVQNRCSQR